MGWGRRVSAALVGCVATVAAVGAPVAPVAAGTGPAPDADPWIVERPRFEPIGHAPMTVDGDGYRGALEVASAGGGLAVINHVTLDDYLRGISEVPPTWPLEAQRAQAIAARTYALWETTRETNSDYKQAGADICATQACQVYRGMAKERQQYSEAWTHAVTTTKNQVLLYKGGPIVAKYSSSNGGHTVSGGQPYLRATPDPDDVYSPLHQWRASFPAAEVARITALAAEPVALHRADREIVATYVDPEGNPVEQRILTEDFRDRLNNALPAPAGLPLPVPSRRFDVQIADGIVHIDGRGWGHGIGLSQYGALGKALRGLKAPDILAAYYAGLKPTTVAAERMPERIRVALDLGAATTTIGSDGGRFRVVDADGTVIAHSATGAWKAVPAPGDKVRLDPPADQRVAPTASIQATAPERPIPGEPLTITVHLDGPAALTTIDLVGPDGSTQALDAQTLRLAGPVQIRLGSAHAGTYRLDIHRDAGTGTGPPTTTSLTVDVPAATSGDGTEGVGAATVSIDGDLAAASTADHPLSSTALQALATVMLVAVIALGSVWVGRRPGPELH